MDKFNFYSPTRIIFGESEENNVGKIINEYGFKNILFVYGTSSIKKTGLYDKVVASLKENDIKYTELSGVEANPKVELVRIGQKLVKELDIDFILAVGGGSVIDTSKAVACSKYLECDPWLLNIKEVAPKKALPIGVVLTISAAGSELSNSCVISNTAVKIKNGFNSDLVRPLFAIENPVLTYTVSPYQTACGVCDIMMHTLERYLSDTTGTFFADEMAIGLLKSTYKAGLIVKDNPSDYDARGTLMLASSFSHNGLTGLGMTYGFTVHKLEHRVSGDYDYVAHGAGLSVLYPAWAKAVYKYLPKKFARIARDVFGIVCDNDEEAALKGIEFMYDFFKELGLPVTLNELKINAADFERMADVLTKNDTVKVPGFVQLDKKLVMEIFNLAK